MATALRLMTAEQHYPPGLTLHTASSGAVPALHALYLVVRRNGELIATGEVRTNIEYLSGVPEARLIRQAQELTAALDWRAEPEAILERLPEAARSYSAPARALIDCTLHDWLSRRANQPLVEWLGGALTSGWPTNQTLFWGDDDSLEAQARDYVARGFRSLKLRVGIGAFEGDLRRIRRVRDAVGEGIELALDANGRWSLDDAMANFARLEPLGIAYVEQPLPAGDWAALARLQSACGVPIMLDESVGGPEDIASLLALDRPPSAHLKLVKMGGIAPLVAAARQLTGAGIEVMVGQMNEGGLATAAAVHCAMLLRPQHAELYGADGLIDDPASGLTYEDGRAVLPAVPGLGPTLHEERTRPIWEITV